MSTHNIWFRQEIRKILCGYPLLSVAMSSAVWNIVYAPSTGLSKVLSVSITFFICVVGDSFKREFCELVFLSIGVY